jgi:sugar lactone lactonase YvrE
MSPRRLYSLLILILAVALLVLLSVLLFTARTTVAPTTSLPPTSSGTPSFRYAVNGPAGQPFTPRGGVMIGGKAVVADSEGARLAVLDVGAGSTALQFIPVAPDLASEDLTRRPQPNDVAVTSDGTLLVTDTANGRVWRLTQDGRLLGDFPDPEERVRSSLVKPVAIAVTGSEVYVSDVSDQRIKVYSDSGRFLRALGGSGYLPGRLSFPTGIDVGRDGVVYVADSNNRRVQILGKDGRPLVVITQAGSQGPLRLPRSVALDRFGRLHVADTFAQVVDVFDQSGAFVLSYGPSSKADQRLSLPQGVTVGSDSIVVSDSGNHRLMVYGY